MPDDFPDIGDRDSSIWPQEFQIAEPTLSHGNHLPSEEWRLEEGLGAPEPLVSDGDGVDHIEYQNKDLQNLNVGKIKISWKNI